MSYQQTGLAEHSTLLLRWVGHCLRGWGTVSGGCGGDWDEQAALHNAGHIVLFPLQVISINEKISSFSEFIIIV